LERDRVTISVNGRNGVLVDENRNPQLLSAAKDQVVATFRIGGENAPDRESYNCIRDSFVRQFKTGVQGGERHYQCNMEMSCYPSDVVLDFWIKVDKVAGKFGHSSQETTCGYPFGGERRWHDEFSSLKPEQVPQGFTSEADMIDNFVRRIGEGLRWRCGPKSCDANPQVFAVFLDTDKPCAYNSSVAYNSSLLRGTMTATGDGWKTIEQRDALIGAILHVIKQSSKRQGYGEHGEPTGRPGETRIQFGYFAPTEVAVRMCNYGSCSSPYQMSWSISISDGPNTECVDAFGGAGAVLSAGLLNFPLTAAAGAFLPWFGGFICNAAASGSGRGAALRVNSDDNMPAAPPVNATNGVIASSSPMPQATPLPEVAPPASSAAAYWGSSIMHAVLCAMVVLYTLLGALPA
jgi:hypothetical protein